MKRGNKAPEETPKFKRQTTSQKGSEFKRGEIKYTPEQQKKLNTIIDLLETCKIEISTLINSASTRNVKEIKLFLAKSKVAELISLLTGEPFYLGPVKRNK